MASLNSIVSARVREERTRLGLSQFELLRRADFPVQPNAFSHLENGKREWKVGWIERFAAALGIPPQALLMESGRSE